MQAGRSSSQRIRRSKSWYHIHEVGSLLARPSSRQSRQWMLRVYYKIRCHVWHACASAMLRVLLYVQACVDRRLLSLRCSQYTGHRMERTVQCSVHVLAETQRNAAPTYIHTYYTVTFLTYISNACHSLLGVAERLQHTYYTPCMLRPQKLHHRISYQGFQLWSPLNSFTNACHSCQSGMWLQHTVRTIRLQCSNSLLGVARGLK